MKHELPMDSTQQSGLPDFELQDLLEKFITDERLAEMERLAALSPKLVEESKQKSILRKKGQTAPAKAMPAILTPDQKKVNQFEQEIQMLINSVYLPDWVAGKLKSEERQDAISWDTFYDKKIKQKWEDLKELIAQQPSAIKTELNSSVDSLDAVFAYENFQNFAKENYSELRENLKIAIQKLVKVKYTRAKFSTPKIKSSDLDIFLADAIQIAEAIGLIVKNKKFDRYSQLLYQDAVNQKKILDERGKLNEHLFAYILQRGGLICLHTTPFIDGVRIFNRGDISLLKINGDRFIVATIDVKTLELDAAYEQDYKNAHSFYYIDTDEAKKTYNKLIAGGHLSPSDLNSLSNKLNQVFQASKINLSVGIENNYLVL